MLRLVCSECGHVDPACECSAAPRRAATLIPYEEFLKRRRQMDERLKRTGGRLIPFPTRPPEPPTAA